MSVKNSFSMKGTPAEVAAELKAQLHLTAPKLVLYFAASSFDPV